MDQLKLCTIGTAYYFAVQPELYRMTSMNMTLTQEEDAQRAMSALRLWRDVLATTKAMTLVQQAEEDWKKMGPINPVIKQEKKTNSEIPALPSPRHSRSHEFQTEDFTIGKITVYCRGPCYYHQLHPQSLQPDCGGWWDAIASSLMQVWQGKPRRYCYSIIRCPSRDRQNDTKGPGPVHRSQALWR